MSKAKDLTGQRFGKLVVVKRAGSKKTKGGAMRATWWCQCDCGSPLKMVAGDNLIRGRSTSCGCSRHKTNRYDLSGEYGIGYTFKGEEFYFDLEDYDKIKDYCWCKSIQGYIFTNLSKITGCSRTITLHILIMGQKDGYIIDHKNRRKNDCRKENLRYVSKTENNRNVSIAKNNITGIIGVRKRDDKYISYITVNKKSIYLGIYSSLEDATIARLKAEKEYFGDFAPQKHLFEQYGI